jgi:hypothetical protein
MLFEKKIKKMFNIILIQIFTKWYKLATQKLENASQKNLLQKRKCWPFQSYLPKPLVCLVCHVTYAIYSASNIPNT